MKHKLQFRRCVALLLLLVVSSLSWAYDFEVDGICYKKDTYSTNVSVTSKTYKYSGSVTIPSSVTYDGTTYSVTEIGTDAFRSCFDLTSVTIPESVTKIGYGAFQSCWALSSIIIPDKVGWIDQYAFASCTALTSVVLSSNLISIGNYAFSGCNALTSVILPSTLYSIGNYAFSGCNTLTSVTCLASRAPNLGTSAFPRASSMTLYVPQAYIETYKAANQWKDFGTIKAPEPVSGFCGYNLDWSFDLTTGHLTITGYGDMVNYSSANEVPWSKYSSYIKFISLPEGITSIGAYAFSGAYNSSSLVIPKGVTSIEGYAFADWRGLSSVIIPEGVQSVGESAFRNCAGLTSIAFPSSTTSIGKEAFNGCSNLSSVTCMAANVPSTGEDAFDNVPLFSAKLYVPESSVRAYYFTNQWKAFGAIEAISVVSGTCGDNLTWKFIEPTATLVIEGTGEMDNMTVMPTMTSTCPWYEYASAIKLVSLPEGLTSIGAYAFYNCTSLMSINIPEGVMTIGRNAFSGCSSLTYISIPESITNIDYMAFYGCSTLTKVEFASIESLCGATFSENPLSITHHLYLKGRAEEVTDLVIPEGVTSIGRMAFYGASYLTSVSIPSTVTQIASDAFCGCSGLTKVEFASIESLCGMSFSSYLSNPLYYAKQLYIGGQEVKNLVIPGSVTSIGSYAFYGFSGLTSVSVPASVTTIGLRAFSNCSKLSSIQLSEGVQTIKEKAFEACTNLTYVILPSSIRTIDQAFTGCTGLASVYIPEGIVTIGKEAFRDCSSLSSVTLPSSVKSIERDVFNGCSKLTYVTLPEGLTSIGNDVFSNCSKLPSIAIPSTVTSIGKRVFYACSNLMSVTCLATNVPGTGESAFYNVPQSVATLTVPTASVEAYRSAEQWKEFGIIQPNDPSDVKDMKSSDADIDENAPVYDLNGRRLTEKPKSGIYLQGGRKYIAQ